MNPAAHLFLPAVLACALAACAMPGPPPTDAAPARNHVKVERTLYRHVVDFAGDASEAGEGERQALHRFLRDSGADRDATVVVTAAGSGDLAERRRQSVVRLLRRMGYRPRPEDPLLDPRPESAGDVLVRVARYHAVLPDCPDHSRSRMGDYYNMPTSNFGCGDQRNLGMMVANPRDLLRGRALVPADAEHHALAIQDYRTGDLPHFIEFKKDGTILFKVDRIERRKE